MKNIDFKIIMYIHTAKGIQDNAPKNQFTEKTIHRKLSSPKKTIHRKRQFDESDYSPKRTRLIEKYLNGN